MPLALVVLGLLLIVSGARGTYGDLKNLLVNDFTGQNNFIYWIAAICAIGTIGYIPKAQTASRMFMGLVILGIVVRNGGVFDKFSAALKNVSASPVADAVQSNSSPISNASATTSASSSGGGGMFGGGSSGGDAGDAALSGAEQGAMAGSVAGPWGMVIGAVVGAAAGAASSG